MSSFPNKIYQSVNSTIRRFVDVDSLVKNEELQMWYGRFRQAGFLLLLLNVTYIGLYIGYKVVVDFTVSSFLFGYFMSMICSFTSFVQDMWTHNQKEIQGILNQNTHLLKSVIDKGINLFVSCPYTPSASVESNTHVSSSRIEQKSEPVVDLRQSIIESYDSDSDKPQIEPKNTACIQLNGTDSPVITTTVSLDPSLLEYISKKREHDEEFMRKMGVLKEDLKPIEQKIEQNNAVIKEYNDEDLSDAGISDIDLSDDDSHESDTEHSVLREHSDEHKSE